jgi:hypothetical protein
MSEKDSSIILQFHSSYCLQDGRRVVSLPRKEHVPLSSNYQNAENRFHAIERRLERDVTIRKVYHNEMFNYIKHGHVEIATTANGLQETYYLPHHLVKKDKRGNVKWRIVFDEGAHERDTSSLNDTLEMGPNLLPELLSLMLRFRQHPLAIIGDISQAFLQLTLHQRDRLNVVLVVSLLPKRRWKLHNDRRGCNLSVHEIAIRTHVQPLSSLRYTTGASHHT